MNVYTIYKEHDIKAKELLPHIQNVLENHNHSFTSFCIDRLPELTYSPQTILLALGGDGTILNLVYHNKDARLPIISINTGNIGFFTTFSSESWRHELIPTLANISYEDVSLLSITSGEYSDIAMNEVSITRSGVARNISIRVTIDTHALYSFRGDGILIATQYGSSAYSRSVGGSLIHPSVDGHIISPIVPSSRAIPPLVIPSSSHICIEVEAFDATITCDGQRVVPFTSSIHISKRKETIPFISFIQSRYYQHLQDKNIW